MPKLPQESLHNNPAVLLEPYDELMMKALLAALAHPPNSPSVWLMLDRSGRNYLEAEGLYREDVKLAINAGVRRGLILRRVLGGCPAIALKRLVQR